MRHTFKIMALMLVLFAFAVACSEDKAECTTEEKPIQKPLNPNGDSELALLMRAMFEDAEQIKQQIANGGPFHTQVEHEKVLTAVATEPEKAASAEYQAFAQVYLQTIHKMETADPSELSPLFDLLVENCMTCHQALCPGPISRIKKLR